MKYVFSGEWFGIKLRAWIGDKPLRMVAEDTGVHFSTLSRVRAGRTPDVDTFLNLCAHMQVDPLDFAFNEDLEPEEV